MALNFNNVNAIDIPEGSVKEISINGTTVWKAKYVWIAIEMNSQTIGSTSDYIDRNFAYFPANAVSLKLTLSYSQTPNNYSYYETNLNTLSMDTVENRLSSKPTTLTIPLDGSQYLLAIRYRSYRQNDETYMRYWYLQIENGYNRLELERTRSDNVTPSNTAGLYPITITKIEALIPNPD